MSKVDTDVYTFKDDDIENDIENDYIERKHTIHL